GPLAVTVHLDGDLRRRCSAEGDDERIPGWTDNPRDRDGNSGAGGRRRKVEDDATVREKLPLLRNRRNAIHLHMPDKPRFVGSAVQSKFERRALACKHMAGMA